MKHLIIYTFFLFILCACSSDDSKAPHVVENTLDVPNVENQWTYVSLENGTVVGATLLGDSVAEKEFNQRTDWDIAICNGVIRTNSGTSGTGRGGISVTSEAYETVDLTSPVLYSLDVDTISMPQP